MFKKLLMVGTLLLVLMAGFAMVPAKQAHAASETCKNLSGQPIQCGADPNQAGCWANVRVVAESDITYPTGSLSGGIPGYPVQIKSPTWAVELIESQVGGACSIMMWAYLKRVSGSGCIYPDAQSLEVEGQSIDSLASTTFCNGAYTNMVLAETGSYEGGSFAQYTGPQWPAGSGNYITMWAGYNGY